MEKYFGLKKETIEQMIRDYTVQLNICTSELLGYPKDGLMYTRVRRIALEIKDLTEELEFRNDEIIERL